MTRTIYQDSRDRGRFHLVVKVGDQVTDVRLKATDELAAEREAKEIER